MLFLLASEGILGNEMVDEVVKEACSSAPRRFFLIPYPDLQAEARSKSQLRFHNYLKSKARDIGAYYSTLYLSESVKPWYFKLPLNRSEIVLVNRLRSNHYNHYNLNYSLYRKNTIDSCGNPRQDVNHIIFNCPLTMDKSGPLSAYLRNFSSQNTEHFPLETFLT